MKKGMQVFIEGKLRNRHWEDKEGNKKHSVEIVSDNFMILTRNQNPQTDQLQNNISITEPTLANIINEFPESDNLGDLPF